jgi:hypothetical protein
MSEEHKYLIRYKIESGVWSKKELKKDGWCGTDNLIWTSVLYPPDGSLSTLLMSMDGRFGGRETDVNEYFKAWVMMAGVLAKKQDLPTEKRELAKAIFETVRQSLLNRFPCNDPQCACNKD